MLIIDANNIKKNFGDREIISFEELKIRTGDKIGIVGLNGAGKSTLLNILAGEILPDEGKVKRFCEIAYIKQFSDEKVNAEEKALSEFMVQGKANSSTVSGGERTRLKIAGALSKNSLLLLADEPTANLDIKGKEVLKEKLMKAESLVLISHDRDLLNSLCNKIIEISEGKLTTYEGNFSFYQEQKQSLIEREGFEYESYIDERNHLEAAIENRQGRAKRVKKTPSRMGNSEARLHKRSATEREQKLHQAAKSLQTRLDKLEVKNRPKDIPTVKLDFSLTNPPENRIVISSESFSFSYGSNVIFKNAGFKVYNRMKQAIVGDNGSGKTTLLNQIYKSYQDRYGEKTGSIASGEDGARKRQTIMVAPRVKLGYFHQSFENLDETKTILENVLLDSIQNETTVRTILARLLFSGDSVYKKVNILSGGEKIKVSFAKLFVSDANVLLLDEPTNFLDMASIEALQNILGEYEGTVLFVSHDKAFVNGVAQRLLVVKDRNILEFEGNLDAYNEQTSKKKQNTQVEKMLLEMRMTDLLSKLSQPKADTEKLEAEYQDLLSQMRML